MKEEVKKFEAKLQKLLKKKRLTGEDIGMLEVMVYIAVESNNINIPNLTYEALEYSRKYCLEKSTRQQQEIAGRYYTLMGEIGSTVGSRLSQRKALRSYVQERLDSVTWSLCQNEHIEGALITEKLLPEAKVIKFSCDHLNSLTDNESVENYRENIDNCIENALHVLYFLRVYKEIIKTIADAYSLPELLLLLDDTIDCETFCHLGSTSKAQIMQYIYNPTEEKKNKLNYIFENYCALESFDDISDSIKENIRDYIEIGKAEGIPRLEPLLLKAIDVFKAEVKANDERRHQAPK